MAHTILSKIKQWRENRAKKKRLIKALKNLNKSQKKLSKAIKRRKDIQKGKLPWWY